MKYFFLILLSLCPAVGLASVEVYRGTISVTNKNCDVRKIEEKANVGDPEAQFDLARAYETGCGVPKNYALAAALYDQLAEAGNSFAQSNLGTLYENGNGVPLDLNLAVYWYRKSADQMNAYGLSNLGNLYFIGKGVERDLVQAFKYHLLSAEKGSGWAQRNVGLAYVYGDGVEKNYKTGMEWYLKAVGNGDNDVLTNIGWLYERGWGVEKNYKIAAEWYRRGANIGDPYAQFNLGALYERGNGVAKDIDIAIEWYRKAAEQGDAYAQRTLGNFYRDGFGVNGDDSIAVSWYRMAADQEDSQAQIELALMYKKGRGVEKDSAASALLQIKAEEKQIFNNEKIISAPKNSLILSHLFNINKDASSLTASDKKYRVGKLATELVVTDNIEKFYAVWNSEDENAALPVVESISLGQSANAFVILQGCNPNERGRCTIGVSYRIYYPIGKLFSISTTDFPLHDSIESQKIILSQIFNFKTERSDPTGFYLVIATVQDLNSDAKFELKKIINVIDNKN